MSSVKRGVLIADKASSMPIPNSWMWSYMNGWKNDKYKIHLKYTQTTFQKSHSQVTSHSDPHSDPQIPIVLGADLDNERLLE